MKQSLFITVILLLVMLSIAAPAQNQPQNPNTPRRGGQRNSGGKWRKLDINNDGSISRAEWNKKPRAFDRLDVNRDGSITREEIRARKGRRHGRNR